MDKLGICVVFLHFCSLSARRVAVSRVHQAGSAVVWRKGEGRFPPSLHPEGREVSFEQERVAAASWQK